MMKVVAKITLHLEKGKKAPPGTMVNIADDDEAKRLVARGHAVPADAAKSGQAPAAETSKG
ncbi:MAG: hypothetical protein WC722_11465 [Rhodospirillales bacterium]|jgi:hypothetical protein